MYVRKFGAECAREAEVKETVLAHRPADIEQQHESRARGGGPSRPAGMAPPLATLLRIALQVET